MTGIKLSWTKLSPMKSVRLGLISGTTRSEHESHSIRRCTQRSLSSYPLRLRGSHPSLDSLMQLLTDKIKKALPSLYSTEDIPCEDKQIVVKFFNPLGSQTWEITEGSYQEDMDTWLLFGKCDLGYGAEWGYVTLSELESVDVGLGMGIERDICWNSHLHDEWNTMEA